MPTIFVGGWVIADAELSGGNSVVVRVGFGCGIGFVGSVGVGFTIFLPLLHMSFLPDFTQVKTSPSDFDVAPALGHEAPGVIIATAMGAPISKVNNRINRIARRRFIE
jgi:hypothetical protein